MPTMNNKITKLTLSIRILSKDLVIYYLSP